MLIFAAAVAFASSWIDDPPDSTCGSVWRTDLWTDRDGCRTPMVARSAVSAVMTGVGIALVVAAALGRRTRSLYVVSVVAVLVAGVVLLIDGNVRSGGGWLV